MRTLIQKGTDWEYIQRTVSLLIGSIDDADSMLIHAVADSLADLQSQGTDRSALIASLRGLADELDNEG